MTSSLSSALTCPSLLRASLASSHPPPAVLRSDPSLGSDGRCAQVHVNLEVTTDSWLLTHRHQGEPCRAGPSCGQAVALTDASPLCVVVSGSPGLLPGPWALGAVGASSRVLVTSGHPSPVRQRTALPRHFSQFCSGGCRHWPWSKLSQQMKPDTCRYSLHTSITRPSCMSVTASKLPRGYPHCTEQSRPSNP